MASPSSATRAAISSREIRMRPSCRSTVSALLGRDEGGERALGAQPLGDDRGLLAGPVRPHAHPEAGLAVLRGHAGHVGLEPGGREVLPRILGLTPVLEGT